jgi:hypothetical protein
MTGIRRRDEDFDAEIEAHIGLETDRLVSEGMPPAEADLERWSQRGCQNPQTRNPRCVPTY